MSVIPVYKPLPISFTHGKGVWLYDRNNNKYLDSFSGIGVSGLGHSHPDIVNVIKSQAEKVIHTSNMVEISQQLQLAQKMIQICQAKEAFFCNSGAESNEMAIKLTRLFGHRKEIATPSIIVMNKSFHGRTMATLTASGSRKVQAGFDPLVPGFIRAPYNDIKAINTIAENRADVVAVMLETVQGEGGINPADTKYLTELSQICKKNDWLLIFDEVQTGNGRLGKLYDFINHNVVPDILTTAKGLGNGMPIGACIMNTRASGLMKPGNHGSTYGGNPLATSTALTVLDVIERDNLCNKVTDKGAILKDALTQRLIDNPHVVEIRGSGFMLGIELDKPASDIRLLALQKGLLLNVTAETVIRLLPPLIIDDNELEYLIDKVVECVQEFTELV